MRLSALEATIAVGIARDRHRASILASEIDRIFQSGTWTPPDGRVDDLYVELRDRQQEVDARIAALYEVYPVWIAYRVVAHSTYLYDQLLRGESLDENGIYEYNTEVNVRKEVGDVDS